MIKWLTVAFALLLLAIVTAATMGWAEPAFAVVRRIPGGDKSAHILLLGTMSLLLNSSLGCARVRCGNISVLKGSLILFALVTLEEISQIWMSSRTFSWGDLACNYLGIFILGWVATFISHPESRRHND